MTFSIVARDPKTGVFGVATATAGPMVGALVPHARARVGAVATQAMTNPYLALDALDALEHLPASTALDAALARDKEADRRQVVLVDSRGEVAGWTGPACTAHAGHVLGAGVAVAGNMLAGPGVLPAMMAAFEAGTGHLAERLLAALVAGAAAGGDSRGIGSAALKLQGGEAYPDLDLRIDLSAEPLADLTHLLGQALSGSYAEFFAQVPRRSGG